MAKLQTVNVISIERGIVDAVHSFTDDDEGNAAAEEKFADELRTHDQDLTDEYIQNYIEDGYFSFNGHNIFITHSS